MKNIAFINAINLSPHMFETLPDGQNAFQYMLTYSQHLPELTRIILLTTKELDLTPFCCSLPLQQVIKYIWTVPELLNTMAGFTTNGSGSDHFFYYYADCPLLDKELTDRMYHNHLKYFAEYTFADGYPYGFAPEIFKKELPAALLRLVDGTMPHPPIKRNSLFELIKKDINNFDIETEISPVDLRLLRLSLTADTKRNHMLLKQLFALVRDDATPLKADSLVTLLKATPALLRTLPAFFNIQLVEGCLQNCSYCPYPAERGEALGKRSELALDRFDLLLEQISAFSEDTVISLSLWGEPALHSQIYEIIKAVLTQKSCELLIETSGLGWKEETLQRLKEDMEKGMISTAVNWIVSLDAISPTNYTQLRGEGLTEAREFINLLTRLFPQERVYVQAVRMKENEEELEQFYRYWKNKQVRTIIQKYDTFCRRLPDRQVTDLSPLKRFPCWHIKRDVSILINGDVPLCREDLGRTNILGNIFKDGLESIWAKGKVAYEQHIANQYPTICQDCDEYYTYNF